MAAIRAASPASAIPTPTRIPASSGTKRPLREYIKDPRAKIPGTKMIFAGVKNEQEIKDLWAYIKQFDAEGNIKK